MDTYIEKNRGAITASKLKCFIKSPEAYYRQYVLETPIERSESTAMMLGTCLDDWISYGPDYWNDKYYLKESRAKNEEETRQPLTPGEYEKVIGMIHEANRQPLWDLGGEYEKQACIEAMYKGSMKLKGTLDRLNIEKSIIRDTKTTGNLRNFSFELSTKYGYEVSMAFYYLLVKIARGVECDLYLDVVQSSGVYQSEVFCYQKEKMNQVLIETIFPALEKLHKCTETYNLTGNASVWMERPMNRFELFELDAYPMLESGLQESISFI